MIFFHFLFTFSVSIYVNLSISSFRLSKSRILFSRSPILITSNLNSLNSILQSISFSKILISNSLSSFLYSKSNLMNLSVKDSHFNSFLSQPFYIRSEEKCDVNGVHQRKIAGAEFKDLTFCSCVAGGCNRDMHSGGAFYFLCSSSDIKFERCKFYECMASIQGGALFYTANSIEIQYCLFEKCSSGCDYNENRCIDSQPTGCYGAAIANFNSKTSQISFCNFSGNYIHKNRGSNTLFFEKSTSVNIINSFFNDNTSCKSNIAFKNDLPVDVVVSGCCFVNQMEGISAELNPAYAFNFFFDNNSFLHNFKPNFASHTRHNITGNNFYNNDYCLYQTKTFTPSNRFTSSDSFRATSLFTLSDAFSSTNKFSSSSDFTHTLTFSSSHVFTKTEFFSDTNAFSLSDYFSLSSDFSFSSDFSKSDIFSLTSEFTFSNSFSASKTPMATSTPLPTPTKSPTYTFTKSDVFSFSEQFSSSFNFTGSNYFTVAAAAGKGVKLSSGGIAGIIIACLVLLAIIVALIILFLHRKKSAFIPPEDDPMNIDGLEIPVNMYD